MLTFTLSLYTSFKPSWMKTFVCFLSLDRKKKKLTNKKKKQLPYSEDICNVRINKYLLTLNFFPFFQSCSNVLCPLLICSFLSLMFVCLFGWEGNAGTVTMALAINKASTSSRRQCTDYDTITAVKLYSGQLRRVYWVLICGLFWPMCRSSESLPTSSLI